MSNKKYTVEELEAIVLKFVKERDWGQFHNPKDTAISLSLEASELLEHFQWKNPEEIKRHIAENKSEIADEAADVLYWVLLICHYLKIDLSKALVGKIAKNSRKYPVKKSRGRHTKYTKL